MQTLIVLTTPDAGYHGLLHGSTPLVEVARIREIPSRACGAYLVARPTHGYECTRHTGDTVLAFRLDPADPAFQIVRLHCSSAEDVTARIPHDIWHMGLPDVRRLGTQQEDRRATVRSRPLTNEQLSRTQALVGRRLGLQALARQIAQDRGVDPRLLAALVTVESGWNPAAVSRKGALGITQLMPATARDLGVDPFQPAEALDGAARLLARYLTRYGSSTILTLIAYNAGPRYADRAAIGLSYPPESLAYAERVIEQMQ